MRGLREVVSWSGVGGVVKPIVTRALSSPRNPPVDGDAEVSSAWSGCGVLTPYIRTESRFGLV